MDLYSNTYNDRESYDGYPASVSGSLPGFDPTSPTSLTSRVSSTSRTSTSPLTLGELNSEIHPGEGSGRGRGRDDSGKTNEKRDTSRGRGRGRGSDVVTEREKTEAEHSGQYGFQARTYAIVLDQY